MSKCNISVEIDKPEHQFSTDETVTGKVIVDVNKDVNCRGVKVGGYWKTHGRGNRDASPYNQQVVFEGPLTGGDRQTFPFSLPLANVPLTYRGKLINLDHYVDVRIDIPWGLDPKHRAEFIVLPGSTGRFTSPVQQTSSDVTATALKAVGIVASLAFLLMGMMICLVGLVVFPPAILIGILFLGMGPLIGFFTFRKFIAEGRLGKVTCQLAKKMAAPTDQIPLEVRFTAKKAGAVNGVMATLVATEAAVSGSGTNKTTHRHKIHYFTFPLEGPSTFQTGQQVTFRGAIQIPETQAYSFRTGANSLGWTLTVKIDIPGWPDWVKKENLSIVPREFLYPDSPPPPPMPSAASSDAPAAAPKLVPDQSLVAALMATGSPPPSKPAATTTSAEDVSSSDRGESASVGTAQPDQTAAAATAPEVDKVAEAAPQPAQAAISLEETCAVLKASSNDRDDQTRILKAIANQTFPLVLEIERISSTYNWEKDSIYNKGKTLVGTLQGTDHQIQLQTPHTRNDDLSQLRSGDTWTGTGKVTGRDSLFNRIEMLAD